MSNQPCQHCLRGLTIGRNEVCEPCKGTGFEQAEVQVETVVQKVKEVVKKAAKKVLKKK